MAQFVGGAYIGATAVRQNFFSNAKYANEPKDQIRAQDEIETVPCKKRWYEKRPKIKLGIREKQMQRKQFRWKRIKPEYNVS